MVKFNATNSKSSTSDYKIHKTIKSVDRSSNEETGVKELLGKLRSILPTASDKLSTLDIMQHAIYYIHDLNDLLATEKPSNSDDEKENQHFCQSDMFAINDNYNEKQQRFNASSNSFHTTPVF